MDHPLGSTAPTPLTGRSRFVLHAIVRAHIHTGGPVASRAVAIALRGRWASATIRNEMAALAERGYLSQPHASAGRVPTPLAYRDYVDALLRGRQGSGSPPTLEGVTSSDDPSERFRGVCAALSSRAQLTGILIAESLATAELDHLHFVRLAPRLVVALVATRAGAVVHKPIELDAEVDARDVERLNQYAQEHFRGLALATVRDRLKTELEGHGDLARALSDRALGLASRALEHAAERAELFIEGRGRLLNCPEFSDLAQLRGVLGAIEERETWLSLLEATLREPGLVVHFGERDIPSLIDECAVVTAPFRLGGRLRGRVGVLGPIRMDYPRMVGLVRAASAALGT